MDSLPTELLLEVFSHLSVADLASAALVHRKLLVAATESLFPRAVVQDEALHMSSEHWAGHRPMGESVPLAYVFRVVQTGRLDHLRRLVAAGAHLGHFMVPACLHTVWKDLGSLDPCLPSLGTPLHAAAAADDIQMVRYLLSQNAAVDAMAFMSCLCHSPHIRMLTDPDCHGFQSAHEMPSATPLHAALAHNASDDTVLLLLSHGAAWDLPLVQCHGITALHIMAANGRASLLRKMAGLGFRASDWPDHQGYRALHYAACFPAAEDDNSKAAALVTALLRIGAKPDQLSSGWPSHYAPARRLVSDFERSARAKGATKPTSTSSDRASGRRMPTDWHLPSGAWVDIDDEVFVELTPAPGLWEHAVLMKKSALAKALWPLRPPRSSRRGAREAQG
ncbi:hypothetical protein ColTof4_14447 [Colletotrichum tofieldiae]|nr:hypothetical protein ColTof3_14831 [Colletotrichum tofieldiae]GKT82024.1 hypothetical protein ColTof4_14447 [Colletotrichum tofieldiae]